MNIITVLKKGQFVLGQKIEKCPNGEFILVNETTIRKEPSSDSDPDVIKLVDVDGKLIGIYKKIQTAAVLECNLKDLSSENRCVTLWGKVS